LLSKSDFFYLLVVDLVGYCCTWSNSITHKHTHTHTHGRNPLDEGSGPNGNWSLWNQSIDLLIERNAQIRKSIVCTNAKFLNVTAGGKNG